MIEFFKKLKNKNYYFLILFFGVIVFLNYYSILFLKPRSFHFIRQTDSLSFISYYLKTGLNFFNIGNLNLYNGTGKTICEFPILYYLTAIVSKLGIEGFIVLKIFHIIIFFFTSYSMFCFLIKKFTFLNSISLTFLTFSSTIILYYAINFIPNFPALCFTFLGLIRFMKYLESDNTNFIKISISYFLIAGLLKITFAIYPIAIFFFLLIRYLNTKRHDFSIYMMFFFLFIILLIWNCFVIYYNNMHHADYYLTGIKPIWKMSNSEIKEVFQFITKYWSYKYYYQTTIHLFLIVTIVSSIFYSKYKVQEIIISLLFICGSICYFVLFFSQFKDHDYYFMEFVPTFFYIFISSFAVVSTGLPKNVNWILTSIVLLITVLSLNYAKLNIQRRYSTPFEQVAKISYILEDIESKMDSINVPTNAKILVVPDYTMNGSLFLANRFGYTIGDTVNPFLNEYFKKSDYLLVTDPEYLEFLKLKIRLNKPILNYRGSELFLISK
ncbi:MAG: hypothetical protein K0R26_808 [Bacteroidota bacterium]|nr:hypothetical protein [Bacteroidota bacterium]